MSIFLPISIPRLPLLLSGAVADGLLTETEFPELGAQAIHFRPIRVVLGEEAFCEKQELVFGFGEIEDTSLDKGFDGLLDEFRIGFVFEGGLDLVFELLAGRGGSIDE